MGSLSEGLDASANAVHSLDQLLTPISSDEVLSDGTRVFARVGKHWVAGNIEGCWVDRFEQTEYGVRTSQALHTVLASDIFLRSTTDRVLPEQLLGLGLWSDPTVFETRKRFLAAWVKEVGACRGLTSLVSADFQPFVHELDAVRRVLSDEHERYLLADEVGLGKTVEAGLIARQIVDDLGGQVIAYVPDHLVAQWRSELCGRLALREPEDLQIVAHGEWPPRLDQKYALLIVDEAHRVGAWRRENPPKYSALAAAAHRYPRLLLLSATPSVRRADEFLWLLHLIDPHAYPLHDLTGFTHKLELRQQIGDFLATFEPGVGRRALRRCADQLRDILPNDEDVGRALGTRGEIVQREEYDQAAADRVVSAIRNSISKSYRLGARLIRASRSLVATALKNGRNEKTAPTEIRIEISPAVLTALEDWRDGWAGSLDPEVAACFGRCSVLPELLVEAVTTRMDGRHRSWLSRETVAALRKDPVGPEELDALHRLKGVLGGLTGIAEIVRELKEIQKSSRRTVIFGEDAQILKLVSLRLSGLGFVTRTHLRSNTDRERPQALREFRETSGPMILFVDGSAEEGANLQVADSVVMLDLPWNGQILEQRLGRLDRLGREAPMAIYVVTHGSDASPHDAWYQVTRDGFGIYEKSVADLQFVLEKLSRGAHESYAREGPWALGAYAANVSETICAERQDNALRQAIDAFGSDPLTLEGMASELEAVLGSGDLSSAFVDWTEAALEVRHRRRTDGALMLELSRDSRFQLDWQTRIKQLFAETGGLAWDKTPVSGLRRLGAAHPLVAGLSEFALLEEEGQAFAFWRTIRNWPSEHAMAIVRQTLYCRPSIDALDEVAQRYELGPDGVNALRRACRFWLPVRLYSRARRLDGTIPESLESGVKKALELPFSTQYDLPISLDTHGALLDPFFSVPQLPRTLKSWSRSTIEQLLRSKTFVQRTSRAAELLERDLIARGFSPDCAAEVKESVAKPSISSVAAELVILSPGRPRS